MSELTKLLNQIETKISHFERINHAVSKSDVGWHIEHSLLTLTGITNALEKSNPKDYEWKFNFIRMVVLTMKKIPRGRAKTPEVVQPKVKYDIESLTNHLLKTRAKIDELQALDKNKYFEHPFFGKLKLKQTINFLEIHTQHHLNIINEILR
ncbi:MAG: DinB family protein [Chitinophagaceae bacterium]|nr:DinB family protein [Chitinophagaceae bacterium]